MPPPAPGFTEAVTTEPFNPNETLLRLLKVRADRLLEVDPAETLIAVRLVATLAVMVDAESPKVTPFDAEKTNDEAVLVVPLAARAMLPCVLATVAEAVTVEPLSPNDTLLELENTSADRF